MSQSILRITTLVVMAALAIAAFASPASAVEPPTFSKAFGTKGSENGQFKEPAGVAVDPEGNVWVADTYNYRVQKFNSKGEFLLKFGTKGTGNGQFNQPWGIATDPSGNVWVADTFNYRVQKFNSKGEFLLKFGTKGSGSGQFGLAFGITADPSGNVWVADTFNYRVQKFNSKGEFLLKSGSAGNGDGQFSEPKGIASDSDGNVWVVDSNNGRIQKLDPKGKYLDKFGKIGSGDGEFTEPTHIGIDAAGTLWVPSIYYKVQGIYPEGEYVTKFGNAGSGEGQFEGAFGVAIAPNGDIWVSDQWNNRIQKWIPGTPNPVTTTSATVIGRTKTTLNGQINPQGKATSYQFEYGTTQSFGTKVPLSPKSIGSGGSFVKVSETLSGLKAGTTYYYRVSATKEAGTTYGETRHFKTLAPAGAEAKWRFNEKTLAELGIEKATFASSGTMTIKISSLNVTFVCQENTTGGEISGTNGVKVTLITLTGCVLLELEEQCKVDPVYISAVSGTVSSLKAEGFNITAKGEECTWFNGVGFTAPTFSLEVGSEAIKVPINTSGTSKFGGNSVSITGVSEWWLTGAHSGKTLGFW